MTTNSVEHDDLITLINDNAVPDGDRWALKPDIIATAILAAGYRKPRTITTVEELRALDVESIIRDIDGLPKEKQNGTGGDIFWAAPGHKKRYGVGSIYLPATVLYETTTEGADLVQDWADGGAK